MKLLAAFVCLLLVAALVSAVGIAAGWWPLQPWEAFR